jgi:guanylate kinase
VGKGTVVRGLLAARPELVFSVSCTTRERRPEERHGVHYRYLSVDEFEAMVERDEFLEWAEVFGERYGTPAEAVEEALGSGHHVLLEVDVQGARNVKTRRPDAVLVFLQPPSEQELGRRLRSRGTEAGQELAWRLEEARREMAEAPWFDQVVVNDRVDRAVEEVLAIIDAATEGDPT